MDLERARPVAGFAIFPVHPALGVFAASWGHHGLNKWESSVDRIVNVAKGHEEARRWDIQQQRSMTPEERLRAARELKDRAYPDAPDVREWHRSG